MMTTDAAEPTTVGNLTVRVVFDEDPTPPWDWDWGATALDENGQNYADKDESLSRYWPDFYPDIETAIRDYFHPVAIRRATTRGGLSWIVVTKADLELTGCTDAAALADGCVRDFETWAEGDVYGYVVEDENGDTLDSCWGFYGPDTDCPMQEGVGIAEWHYARAQEALRASYVTAYEAAARFAVAS